MDPFANDEHDEDDLPNISQYVRPFERPVFIEQRQQTKADDDLLSKFSNHVSTTSSMPNWERLYQTSLRALQDDDDDDNDDHQDSRVEISPRPSFPRQSSQLANLPEEETYPSTFYVHPSDSNATKSKWFIQLPHFLHSTVGPDRPKLETTRRHTTEIVFQPTNPPKKEIYASASVSRPNGLESINPLVKQLKQKFDRMAANSSNTNTISSTRNSHGPSKLRRFTSLTGRGLTGNGGEWLKNQPALMGSISSRVRSVSNTSFNSNSAATTNGRSQRAKAGPPVSYPKHFYPPPSTGSVVKQLIGGGATLVYDSSNERTRTSKSHSNSLNSSMSLAQRRKKLESTNVLLTGRQAPTDVLESDYATINPNGEPEPVSTDHSTSKRLSSEHGENEYDTYYPVFTGHD